MPRFCKNNCNKSQQNVLAEEAKYCMYCGGLVADTIVIIEICNENIPEDNQLSKTSEPSVLVLKENNPTRQPHSNPSVKRSTAEKLSSPKDSTELSSPKDNYRTLFS